MRRTLLLSFILCLVLAGTSLRAQQKGKSAWAALRKPVNVSFASSDTRFAQDQVPQVPQQTKWNPIAWKGEKVHTQVLVWANKKIPKLKVSFSALEDGKGNRIAASHLTAGAVRYVITDEFGKGCGHRKTTDFDSSLVADPIDTAAVTAVAANTVQPVWLSINVPGNTPAGTYKGTVIVQAKKSYKLDISLTVQERELPPPADWAFDLDLWQHPAAVARVHGVPLWSQEHYTHMRPYFTMLAAAGQKTITASIIHEPWNHQTYDDFPSLIKWTKRKDGTWAYDYRLFDQYVSFVMSTGINKRINCYTMVPWKMAFAYFDEATGKDTVFAAKAGTPAYNAFWGHMLRDFAGHLKEKGWFSITSIAMDERPLADMQAVIKLLKETDPDWKIALAGIYHPEIEKDIFDYSIASKWKFEEQVRQARKASGKPSTFYTSCEEAYPNGFTFSPPAEHTWLGWYAAAQGFTGYLRWAYNSWVEHPLQDSRFKTWPAGDTYQVYPGPLTSIRFEKLIEGIQDFEKIRLLREEFSRTGNLAKLQELDKLLAAFEIKGLNNTAAAALVATAKASLHKL
ncbi:glycoside hydrolase domain-containing protein [Rufibacter glacialis]|uniref:DUF4091 domain-containing protein n=1 Tax=Rufibacter glacialis TaxID=1259555 RepID=A0A5M8Q7D4_9BACT|nr:DUF4091 domain-containing protein [Rufibacter glacialis]KAA6431028.1 DUF4091 domain-containing protein [Rufibacter glacialis]GGK83420.1 hypothetical protein GCM10011405_34110 [Rufibacter glacialis]